MEAILADAIPTDTPIPASDIDATVEARVKATTASQPTPPSVPSPTPTPTPTPQVRVVYAIPTDRDYHAPYLAVVAHAILEVQDWYAAQLDGYTFSLHSPTPEVCALEHESEYYENEQGWDRVIDDLQPCAPIGYESSEYVWVVYPDVAFDCERSELGRGGGGITILHRGDLEGLLSPATYRHCGYGLRAPQGWIGGLSHELGHAFGLEHPPGCDAWLEHCDQDALMWEGYYHDYPYTYLTEMDVRMLLASEFFGPAPEGTTSPTNALDGAATPASIRIRLDDAWDALLSTEHRYNRLAVEVCGTLSAAAAGCSPTSDAAFHVLLGSHEDWMVAWCHYDALVKWIENPTTVEVGPSPSPGCEGRWP